ncbi:odorant receptor 30a-like isoform X7 [Polyergus mexicanus]|uniref:odorant receptor 30a-like isoform X7 n=1 Tax=Polyergus mexicanus TaxID=615972 RepID=UPI0038B4B98F
MDTIKAKRYADFEWAIKLNRYPLNLIGLWPRNYDNTYDRFLSDFCTTFSFLLIIFFSIIPSIHSLVRTWGDMIAIIDNLQFTLPISITIIKLVIIRWKRTDLTLALNMIADDWLKTKSEKEKGTMIKYARSARIILIFGYFNIVESTFTLLLLGLLLYFGTVFCLYGFLIVAVLTEGKKMSMIRLIYLISIVLNVGGHMCLYCVVSEILIAQCEGVYHAAYDHKWYTLEPKQAKSLIMIMIRTNKPLHISAGKIFPMTLSMFCDLIKTSGGYISILLASQSS